MSVSLDDLRAFTFVVEERSVSRGAERMGVTQQAVSERIRRIERQLSIDLFRRRPYGMEPTAAGFRLLPYAQRVVTLVDQALRVVDDEDMLRVAVQGSISWTLAFLQDDPGGDRFEVRQEAQVADVLSAVVSGKVDVGFGSFRKGDIPRSMDADGAGGGAGAGSPEATLVVETLFDDPMIWVAPPDHPLVAAGGPVPTGALAGLSLGDALGKDPSASDDGNQDASESEPAVVKPAGVRMVSRSSVSAALYEGRLVELVVDLPTWVLPVSIAYRAADAERSAIATLRDSVVAEHHRAQARESRQRSSPEEAVS